MDSTAVSAGGLNNENTAGNIIHYVSKICVIRDMIMIKG